MCVQAEWRQNILPVRHPRSERHSGTKIRGPIPGIMTGPCRRHIANPETLRSLVLAAQ
jgi:hypothetical protein